ncbi:xanthine dehydrogenase accessory protein XdhC [Kaistia algarum]|uniref:xanthine dehydrogenase accessory protein XdhC n=1 Tax=Kaistia algarum TaxID=2083279 RepID=UPI000CE7FB03|nr:xanthine dehydrogenase accessory protein XdhC [Kaistia algarum]MCX5514824.1 xanthine dehydrogenase accessory protein XdhC [Kaistia algarum]PPE79583.1 xanthine dehydrogenase accessory protein XdhC [Kaistia algarum]
MRLWQRLKDELEHHGIAAMASVIGMQGSTPREAGARVVALPDGSFFGTIGGGTLEWRALADLQALLSRPSPRPFQLRSIALGPELGQCCGGRVELAYEMFGPEQREAIERLATLEAEGPFRTRAAIAGEAALDREVDATGSVAIGSVRRMGARIEEGFGEAPRRLFLYGAGHVGRALVLALAPLPFETIWIDPRPDAFPARVPANVRCIEAGDPPSMLVDAGEGDFVLVMTHNHGLDLAITEAALKRPGIAYLGVIGSASKRARFRRLLGEAGLARTDVDRMTTPIGIAGIRSKLPAAIAASVASDLLIRDEAARHAAMIAEAAPLPAIPSRKVV